jgi:NADH-quinone oxidoreductase subunit J
MQILFLLFAALAVVAAFNVILQRNPLYSAIGLIGTLISVAALFLTLAAPFIAAVQIIVYAGAIVVLFVFVIMLLNVRAEESRADEQKYLRWLAPPLFLALLAEVFLAVRYVGDAPPPLPAVSAADAPRQWLGSVETIGTDMFTTYVLPFEAVSVLILMAIVGAMLLAKRDPQFGRRRAPAEPAAAAGRAEEVGAGARR